MKKMLLTILALSIALSACLAGSTNYEEFINMQMNVSVNGHDFRAELADTAAARDFISLLEEGDLRISMWDNNFEKVGEIGQRLSSDNRQITARAGDIVLYAGDQICLFYGSNSWSYTMIARIKDTSNLTAALGMGTCEVTFSLLH